MRVIVFGHYPNYARLALLDIQPVCGEDFCDWCGDCLHCHGDGPCYNPFSYTHNWAVYLTTISDFLDKHRDQLIRVEIQTLTYFRDRQEEMTTK